MDADLLYSSMDGEMISNIEQPSLHTLTSDESVDEAERIFPHCNDFTYQSSTPLKAIGDVNMVTAIDNDDDVKIDYVRPPSAAFPSSRYGKRYSLTTFNETGGTCYAINKSNSMQDVSSIGSFCPLRRNSCMYSNETLQSNSIATTTHTKDSGFQRSNSCTSLMTNASKKYDHVQSKVKQYIRNIKQTEALHKMQKRMIQNEYSRVPMQAAELGPRSAGTDTTVNVVSKRKLLDKLKELEDELREKDCVIEELEKNQSELRLKYAAAENQIDDLRIRASIYEDPLKKYVSDEKIAQLLTGGDQQAARTSKKYRVENGVARKLMKNMAAMPPPPTPSSSPLEAPSEFAGGRRSMPVGHASQPQPSTKKYASNCNQSKDEYSVLKSANGVRKSSSCKHVEKSKYKLAKSASNIDRMSVTFAALPGVSANDIVDLPYEKNSFAKVQQWQRSLLANAHGGREAAETVPHNSFYYDGTDDVDGGGNNDDGDECDVFAGASTALYRRYNLMAALNDEHDENNENDEVVDLCEGKHRNRSSTARRYQKNKDSDKKQRYRKSYPVGCRCDKFKCKSQDMGGGGGDARKEPSCASARTLLPPNRGKLLRSVSFANYEDSLTSSIYADDETSSSASDSSSSSSSSSSSASMYANKRKLTGYKAYKQQRKLSQTKLNGKREGGGDDNWGRDAAALLKWNEIKKAKSAQNLRGGGKEYPRGDTGGRDYTKRLLDSSSTSQDYSCSDRKRSEKSHQRKYRKLDDCSRMLPMSPANTPGATSVSVKCKSRRGYDHHRTDECEKSSVAAAATTFYDISRSKSCETRHNRKHEAKDKGRRSSKYDCSCLTGLENLKIQEHNTLARFAAADCFRKTQQQKLQQMET